MPIQPISIRCELPVPPATVFEILSHRLGAFWPMAYTFSGPEFRDAGIDPQVGGDWYETDARGQRHSWGKVLAYEPPRRLVLGYGIGGDGRPVPPTAASEVELILAAAEGGKTQLRLEHRLFSRHGEQAERIRESMASPRGWPLILAELGRELARLPEAMSGGATWNVLLALDDSPASEAALESVLTRPWPAAASIRVLAVAPGVLGAAVAGPPVGALDATLPQLTDLRVQAATLERVDAIAQRACERLSAAGLSAQACTRTGSAGHEIVEEARSWPADLVLLGSRAHSGLARLLLGSTAEYVMHHAPCSVEVARRRDAAVSSRA